MPYYVSNALHSYELCSITYDETGSLYEVIFKRMGRGNVEKIKWAIVWEGVFNFLKIYNLYTML